MSTFLLPISLCDELQKVMNSFWWGTNKDARKGIHWQLWGNLCYRKEDGGSSFRHLHSLNLALLGKHGWNLWGSSNATVMLQSRNKKSDISVDILSKYRISASTDTILSTESRLAKKAPIFRRNIESISHARMCCNFWKNIGKISINIGDISIKYRRYIDKISKIYR